MGEAREALLLTHPFFGVLSLKIALTESAECKAFRVSNSALTFNPDYVMSLPMVQLKAGVARCCMHLALMHHARGGSRDPGKWAKACELAVNPILKDDGFDLIPGSLLDAAHIGKQAEAIYNALDDEEQDNAQKQKPQKQQGGQDQGAGSSPGQGKPDNSQGSGGAPGQAGGDDAGGSGLVEIEQAGPQGSSEAADAAREWQENAEQAARVASSAGKLPGNLKAEVKKACAQREDWAALLRRFARDQIRTESTWSRRNKRFSDIYMPGRKPCGMGPMVFLIDTSISVSLSALGRFESVANHIVEDVEPSRVFVIYCDSKVHSVEEFEAGELIRFNVVGRGGTAFQPAFDEVEARGISPACAIYLTDLDNGSERVTEPSYPVLWAAYDQGSRVGAFGETVSIN